MVGGGRGRQGRADAGSGRPAGEAGEGRGTRLFRAVPGTAAAGRARRADEVLAAPAARGRPRVLHKQQLAAGSRQSRVSDKQYEALM